MTGAVAVATRGDGNVCVGVAEVQGRIQTVNAAASQYPITSCAKLLVEATAGLAETP